MLPIHFLPIPGHPLYASAQERDAPKRTNKGTSEEIQELEDFKTWNKSR